MVFFWKLRYNLLITDQWILAYQIWCKCHLKNDVFTAGPPTDLVPAVLHHRYSAEHPLRYPTGVSKFPGRVEVKDATHQGEPRGEDIRDVSNHSHRSHVSVEGRWTEVQSSDLLVVKARPRGHLHLPHEQTRGLILRWEHMGPWRVIVW